MKETQKHKHIHKAVAQIVTPFSLMHYTRHHLMFCDLTVGTTSAQSVSLTSLSSRVVFFADSGAAAKTSDDDKEKNNVTDIFSKGKKASAGKTTLEQRLEENESHFTKRVYSEAKDALKRGNFYEQTLVERLVDGTITSERFEELLEKLGKNQGTPERNLAEMELTGKIKSHTYDLAIQAIETDDIEYTAQKMAANELAEDVGKNPEKEKDFLKVLKKNPLPEKKITSYSTLEIHGEEAVKIGREDTREFIDAYSKTYEEYREQKIDTPEMADEFHKNLQKFKEAGNRKDTVGRELDQVFAQMAPKNEMLQKKIAKAVFDLREDAVQGDEPKINAEQIQTALRKLKIEGAKFTMSPELIQQITQHFGKLQDIDKEFFGHKQKMTDHLSLIEKKALEIIEIDKMIAFGEKYTGVTLKPGTKLKFKQKYYDEKTHRTIEKDTETEIIGIHIDTSAKEKTEWYGREFEADGMPLVIMTGQGIPLTIGRMKKWVDATNAKEEIKTEQELEEKLGFQIKPGTQLQFNTFTRDARPGKEKEISNTVTIMPALQVPGREPRIQLNRDVTLKTPESAPYAHLTEKIEKKSLTYSEFLAWARNYDVSPEYKTVEELAKAAELKEGLQEGQVLASGDAARSMMWLVKKIDLPDAATGKTGKVTLGNAKGDLALSFGEFLRMSKKQHLRNYDVKEEVEERMTPFQGSDDYFPEYERETTKITDKVEKFAQQASRDAAEKQQETRALKQSTISPRASAVPAAAAGAATTMIASSAANDNTEHDDHDKKHGGGGSGGSGGANGGGGHGAGTGDAGGTGEHAEHAEGENPNGSHGDHDGDAPHGEEGDHGEKHGDDHGGGDHEGGDHDAADHKKDGEHGDSAEEDDTMKGLKDVEIPQDGAIRAFWRKTTFLRGADIWELGKACWEYYKRWYEREAKGRYANYGKDLPYLMTEMLKVKEDAEHHEVGQFKSAMVNMGVVEIQHIMHQTKNRDQLKACIEALVEKGQMKWEDIHFWQALNLHLPNDKKIRFDSNHLDPYKGVYIDPTTGKKLSGIDMVKKGIDSMWGDNQSNTWWSSNDGAYTSKMNGFAEKGNQLENDPKDNGGSSAHLQMMLKNHMEGSEWTDPQEYEGFIRFIIENGKSNLQEKFYFIVMGVATGLLTLDRMGTLDGKFLNQMPFLNWLTDTSSKKAFQEGAGPFKMEELKALASHLFHDPTIKKNDEKYLPGIRTRDLLWEQVLRHDRVIRRTQKGVRDAKKIDHEDAQFMIPLIGEEGAEIATTLQSGSIGVLTSEGYLNTYSGYSEYMKVNGRMKDGGKLKKCIKSYIRFDAVLDNRYRPDEKGLARLGPDDYNRPSVVNNIDVMDQKRQMERMIVRIGQAYGYDWSKAFEKAGAGDATKKKEIFTAIQKLGEDFETAIATQGDEKMLKIVQETELYGTGTTVLTPKQREAQKKEAEKGKEAREAAEFERGKTMGGI